MFLLCLIFLINPVFGNSEVDDPKNYRLTEAPSGYEIYYDGGEGWYYTQTFRNDNKQSYICSININLDFDNEVDNEYAITRLRDVIEWRENGGRDAGHGEVYLTTNEIYGIGDEAYTCTETNIHTGKKYEYLYFSKNHIFIALETSDDDINAQSELIQFAKLYDNKINSVPQNVYVNEKTKNSIPFLNSSIIFVIVIVMAIIINRKKRTYKQR